MDKTELVIGRGEVYFDKFAPGTMNGTGERYIGNTESVTVERSLAFEESRTSSGGVRTKGVKLLSAEDNKLTFVTDNMSNQNSALWTGGEIENKTQTMGDGYSETFTLTAGVFYQLGKSIAPGLGVREVWALNIKNASNVNLNDQLYIDEAMGRFGVPVDSGLGGTVVTVTYEIRYSAFKLIKGARTVARGSLRFISRNPVGNKHHFFFPSVVLYPRDTRELKGTSWATMTFEAESLLPMVDLTVTARGQSPGMAALVAAGVALIDFPALESLFHSALNGIA